jgi:preprotein translocase subunit SecB
MANTPDKQPSLLTLTNLIASRVQIKSIRLLNAKVYFNPSEEFEGLTVNFGFDSDTSANENDKTINVKSKFETFAQKGEEADINNAPIRIQGEYELEYSLESFDNIKPENIRAFGLMNGVYNAWPYWREFVQSMTVRMGLPPLTLPVITGKFLENYYNKQKKDESQEMECAETATIAAPPLSTGQSTG